MPKYKNLTPKHIIYHNVTFPPLEEVEVEFYVQDQNLKLISDEPYYNPVAYSQLCSSGQEFDVTSNKTEDSNSLRIFSKSTYSLISFNSSDAPQVIVGDRPLKLGNLYKIDKIFVHEGEVNIEIWKGFVFRELAQGA